MNCLKGKRSRLSAKKLTRSFGDCSTVTSSEVGAGCWIRLEDSPTLVLHCLLWEILVVWTFVHVWPWTTRLETRTRSLTCKRVFGWQTQMRSESDVYEGRKTCSTGVCRNHYPHTARAYMLGPEKMVNYAWIGRSQRKLWWRLVAVTDVQIDGQFGYRGEKTNRTIW